MDYREFEPPQSLAGLVKAGWTLATPPGGSAWIRHEATPDGCIEIIRRLEGRSRWGTEQPKTFVAGLITRPAALELGPGARFIGVRIWPWAWNAFARIRSPALVDRWSDLTKAAPDFVMPAGIPAAFDLLGSIAVDPKAAGLAAFIPGARSVDSLSRRSGWPIRRIQRWFEREIGVPPLYYLRLLRFQESFAGLPTADALAEHAVEHGFSDQAHMAREYRVLAGAPAGKARRRAKGPFL